MIVKGFCFWSKPSPKPEYTCLRKFESLLEIILDDTELIMSDGESICSSTRDLMRSSLKNCDNNELTESGRRIDLILQCSCLNTTVELCSVEFKKDNVTNAEIIHQQSKNARVNSCIFNTLNCITNTANNQIISVVFVGTSGYMTQMFWYKDDLVSHKVCSLIIPVNAHELESLRDTLKYMYLWKKHLLQLSAKVIRELYSNKRKYDLIVYCKKYECT
ncbi:hypothetical protein EDC94DRAFT_150996 [Helicostylum pulchrum]|nr:hypothetical protein EDC94DRAFT_150996 [Helicostylum pulchrum]